MVIRMWDVISTLKDVLFLPEGGGEDGEWYKQDIIIQCAVPTGIQELETSVVRSGQAKVPEKGNFLKNGWLAVSHLGNHMAEPRGRAQSLETDYGQICAFL